MAQYRAYWTKWFNFCSGRQAPPLQVSVPLIVDFLTGLFEKGLGYSTINTAKSAIVTLLSVCTDASVIESSVVLQKFMRGIFALRPALPKHDYTWDVSTVLEFLKKWSPPKALDLLSLSSKLAMLLLLLTGQRGQSIHSLHVDDLECSGSELIVRFSELLKHSRPGSHVHEIVIPGYAEPGLCVVTTFLEYIKRPKALRSTKNGKNDFILRINMQRVWRIPGNTK